MRKAVQLFQAGRVDLWPDARVATVKGLTADYTVAVTLEDGEVTRASCDCAAETQCSHILAVLLQIHEEDD